jgi:heme/copper-type cytochrome/quinol oxidase subunit 3
MEASEAAGGDTDDFLVWVQVLSELAAFGILIAAFLLAAVRDHERLRELLQMGCRLFCFTFVLHVFERECSINHSVIVAPRKPLRSRSISEITSLIVRLAFWKRLVSV